MIVKLSYNDQNRLYNRILDLQTLIFYCQTTFRDLPDNFTFVYQSPNGELTYIQSQEDLIGLKYCCSFYNDSMIKLSIFRSSKIDEFDIDDGIETLNIVKENLKQIAQNAFTRIQEQQSNQAVSDYLSETTENVSAKIVSDQQKMTLKEVKQYLQILYENCSEHFFEEEFSFIHQIPKIRKNIKLAPHRPLIYHSQGNIDRLVSEKVLKLIPSLVDKIYAKIQRKFTTLKCRNCLEKEIEMDLLIDSQIQRRISLACIDDQNPETS